MVKRLLIILALSIPLDACSTMQQVQNIELAKAKTREVCTVAGKVFGWNLVETAPSIEHNQ